MKNLDYYLHLTYPFTLEQDDDGSYFISYPDLPGCMSCGATIEDAIEMGKDAKKCWIESALNGKEFIPEPKAAPDYPDNFKLRMPRSLYRQLAKDARNEGVSMNQYCLYLLSGGAKP